MKIIFILFYIFLSLTSCNKSMVHENEIDSKVGKTIVIKNIEVLKKKLILNQIEGNWYYENNLFSGYSVSFYSNDTLAEKLGFVNGKREGVARRWSENGVLRVESYYKENRLNGIYKTWWENGALASQSNYINNVKQGIENEWYNTGQIAKERQLVDGIENGMQKAWLENGKLYINYEAKNGRIFGMRRANSCYKLEDEIIITN